MNDSSNLEDEDDLTALSLLVGGIGGDNNDASFVSEEQQHEAEAERRRKARRERLTRAQQQQDNADSDAVVISKLEKTVQNSFSENGGEDVVKNDSTSMATESRKRPVEESTPLPMNDDDDDFDMFSSSVSPVNIGNSNALKSSTATTNSATRGHAQEDWDDVEGYYKAVIGEEIMLEPQSRATSSSDRTTDSNNNLAVKPCISLRVAGVIGKGVFSTVLKCATVSNSTSLAVPPIVALKSIRHNEAMAKAAQNEIRTLQRLKKSQGIVQLLLPTNSHQPLAHRGHVLLVFPFFEYNLRQVLQKFGKGVGLALAAVKSYFGQSLSAATRLKKHNVIHADIKPDNILVSADFATVQIADFGSAMILGEPDTALPTPYLVSRFYRAPEIILGLAPTFAIDLWSLAVSACELFLGNVVFHGTSNNDMLYVFMQNLGPFSNRVIRQHLVQCGKMNIAKHFQPDAGTNYQFTQLTTDPVTQAPVHKNWSLSTSSSSSSIQQSSNRTFPLATPLNQRLLKAKSGNDSRTTVQQFSDLISKCLALDPSRRITSKDALQHPFFAVNPAISSESNSSDKSRVVTK